MEEKEKDINIRLVGIDIISKNMMERPSNFASQPPIYNFDIRIQTKVIAEKKFVMPHVTVKITELSKSLKLAEIKVGCLFEIENFQDIIKKSENGLYHIPRQLELLVRPVALSTTRGIIYSEFRGTYLANAIMPIIFVDTMKEEKVEE